MNVELLHTPVPFSSLSNNSIAIDGAVRGTHLDINNNRWSFDHHDSNQHSISTRSTALQVLLALRAGLDVSRIKSVLVSSIDADSVISTALLLKPELANDETVISLIALHLDTIDSMGPAGALSSDNLSIHFALRSGFNEELTTELLMQKVELFFSLVEEGKLFETAPDRKSEVTLISISPDGRNVQFEEGEFGFADLYKSANIGVLYSQERVTVGVKSSFVTNKNLLTDGLFDRLNKAEIAAGAAVSEDGSIVNGWGGKDLVGGSPFKGVTLLSAKEVASIVCDFLKS